MSPMKFLAAAGAALALAGAAAAEGWYVSGAIAFTQQNDSDNAGETGAFTTGNGAPALPFDTAIADGTPYGWTTEFSEGYAISGEAGYSYGNGWRAGVELVFSESDVDTHSGVNVAGTVIDGVDAAVLTGSPTQLGASVGAVVADGQGSISQTAVFANVYYDFGAGGQFQPYVGAGIGFADVDVEYAPSGVGIIDDGETKFAYQLKAGASFAVTETIDVFGEYAYRATEDIEVGNDLFPGSLEIENQSNNFAAGVRLRF